MLLSSLPNDRQTHYLVLQYYVPRLDVLHDPESGIVLKQEDEVSFSIRRFDCSTLFFGDLSDSLLYFIRVLDLPPEQRLNL
jgi:hypothetical protein